MMAQFSKRVKSIKVTHLFIPVLHLKRLLQQSTLIRLIDGYLMLFQQSQMLLTQLATYLTLLIILIQQLQSPVRQHLMLTLAHLSHYHLSLRQTTMVPHYKWNLRMNLVVPPFQTANLLLK